MKHEIEGTYCNCDICKGGLKKCEKEAMKQEDIKMARKVIKQIKVDFDVNAEFIPHKIQALQTALKALKEVELVPDLVEVLEEAVKFIPMTSGNEVRVKEQIEQCLSKYKEVK